MRQSRRSRNWSIWRPSLAAGLAAVAALAIGYFGWRRPADVHQAPGADYTCSAVTEIGASRKLDLPDGSIVHLNTDTAVEVAYSAAERRVRLVHGEAHFTVAKNPARPFIVSADCVDVRAVGTAFDVLMEPEVVEVLVTEGKVRVDESVSGRSLLSADATSLSGHDMKGSMTSQESVLAKGEHAIISLAPTVAAHFDVVAMPPAARACVLAWQHERLEFTSTSLGDAAAQFNRYNRHKLVIADPRLREMTYSGTFRCDGYDAFVRLLESHFGVAAERRQSETILRLAH